MSDEEIDPTEHVGGTVHVLRQTLTCPSCQVEVEHEKRFDLESHGTTCRQPEIRMKRLESRVYDLERIVASMPGFEAAVKHLGLV